METGQKPVRKVSLGVCIVAILLAFVAGNRLQTLGDWFFAPYTNKGGQTLSQRLDHTQTNQIFRLLKQKYDGKLDMAALQEGMARGLVAATNDPYTVFLSASEAEEFQKDLDGTFSGIGAELGRQNNQLVVIAPVDDSPASRAGLRPGDAITKIDEEDATSLSIDQAVTKIRGEAGTLVKLGILRGNTPLELEITRAQITVPSVQSEMLEGNVGYLKITRFSDDTAALATRAATEFKDKGAKSVIVDVRNNGGGLLESAVKVAGLWLENKVVVEEREGDKVTASLRSGNVAPLAGMQTIVLVNGGSASASEILAGALRDHGAATLLGEKTFGKGSVQELLDLGDGAKLKVTVARWFTPNGKNIDKEGISPDVEVKRTDEDYNSNRDPQKDRALQDPR